jgi:hypothetical protein
MNGLDQTSTHLFAQKTLIILEIIPQSKGRVRAPEQRRRARAKAPHSERRPANGEGKANEEKGLETENRSRRSKREKRR